MKKERVLDISWGTILKIAIVFLGVYIIFLIRNILIWTVFGLILSVLFNPFIRFLQEKLKFPRVIATLMVYVTVFLLLSLFFYWTVPILVHEIQQFTPLIPQYFQRIAPPLRGLQIEAFENFESFSQTLQDWVKEASSSIFGALVSVFGGILSMVTIFALAMFFSIEEREVDSAIALLSPPGEEDYFLNLWKRSQMKTSAWFASRILSSVFVGIISFVTLKIIKVKYAFLLSVFAGVTDIVPVLGPIFSGIFTVVIVALDSWVKALFVLIAFLIIQQIEGNIITPLFAKKIVGLPAVLVLISLLVGTRLWGFLGAILAIPLTTMVFEFIRDYLKKRKERALASASKD